jgi:hypothetical protein
MRTRLALLIAAAALSACASPYIYQKEVTSFSSSVTTVAGAVTQGLANIDQDQEGADLAAIVAGRTGVDISPDCGSSTVVSPGACRLLPHGVQPSSLVRADFPEKKLRQDLGVLNAYAEGLAAVTNAQDRKDYDAAASQLASSVGALASTLGATSPAGAAAATALPVVVKFTAWTIGESLDQARFDTLKSALNAVGNPASGSSKSPIQIFADEVITKSLTAIQSARIELLNRQINARTDRINTDLARIGPSRVSVERYDTPVTELVPTTATLNSVRAVDPAAVAASLVKAHDELVKVVNDPKTQYASLVDSIIAFAEQADAVRQAFASKPTSATAASTPNSQ